jgi:hypothetical protein
MGKALIHDYDVLNLERLLSQFPFMAAFGGDRIRNIGAGGTSDLTAW